MSDRQRHRAFAVSVAVVACVCALIWLLDRPRRGDDTKAGRPASSTKPLVLGDQTSASTAVPAAPSPSRIEAVAERFSEAFVRYEVGALSRSVRSGIEATATPRFADSLLSAPPRIPMGVRPPAPARLRSVALTRGSSDGKALVAVKLNSDAGRVELLTLLMLRLGREWRINGLQ
jgi:hypothetical protein